MLLVPSIRQIGEATIFADSDRDDVFYVLPNFPTLRYGPDGKPTFLFLKYREDAATLGDGGSRGGGYVQFDAELRLSDTAMDKIRQDLQAELDRKHQNDPPNQRPKVQLATPQWVDDPTTSVELITIHPTPDGTGLVTAVLGSGGKPSLIGTNVATFGMELTQRGAALLWQGFQMAIMPVGVRYNVSFLARFPSLQMHIWLYANQMHTYSEQISKDVSEGTWSDDDQSYKRTIDEEFSKYQVAGVDIVSWPPNLGGGGTNADAQSLQKEMIEWGWSLLVDTLKNSMTDKFSPVAEADKGEAGDFQHVERDYLQNFNENLDVTVTAEQVRLWPTHPQGTLEGFLNTPGPNGQKPNKADFFKEVSLDDPFFRLLQVRMRCNGDFKNDPIFSVKVHVEYGQRADDYLFQDAGSVQLFQEFVDPALGRKYTYWYEVAYKDSDRTFRSPTRTTDETQLVVGVSEFGFLKVTVAASGFNWKAIDTAQVHLRYSDPANGVPEEEGVVPLTKDATSQNYQRLIYAPVTQPYHYSVTYFLTNGQQVTRDWTPAIAQQLIVTDVFEDLLTVRLLATGGWDRLSKILIDLEYDDTAHSYSQIGQLALTADQDNLVWTVPLWKGAAQAWRYRPILVYKDGHTIEQDWQPATGSQTLTVGEVFADFLTLSIVADLVDFTTVRLVDVAVHYTDSANSIDASENFIFTKDKKPALPWKLPIKDKTHKTYTYHVVYYLADGSQRKVDDTSTSEDTIVLQVPAAPAPAAAPAAGGAP